MSQTLPDLLTSWYCKCCGIRCERRGDWYCLDCQDNNCPGT